MGIYQPSCLPTMGESSVDGDELGISPTIVGQIMDISWGFYGNVMGIY